MTPGEWKRMVTAWVDELHAPGPPLGGLDVLPAPRPPGSEILDVLHRTGTIRFGSAHAMVPEPRRKWNVVFA